MKQCPVCKTTYTDETLRFCLADGSALTDVGGEQPTMVRGGNIGSAETVAMGSGGGQMRVDIPSGQTPPVYHSPSPTPAASTGGIYKVLVVILILGILGLLVVGVAGFIYYKMSGPERTSADNKEWKPVAPAPSPTKDDKEELRDQIANLEKQINEQKKNNQPANIPFNIPNQSATTTTARVNSPGDGFLALRTLPNSEVGERILKIPHGASVSVGACGPVVTPARRSGRWCQASYNGYKGWVFDAYLIY